MQGFVAVSNCKKRFSEQTKIHSLHIEHQDKEWVDGIRK